MKKNHEAVVTTPISSLVYEQQVRYLCVVSKKYIGTFQSTRSVWKLMRMICKSVVYFLSWRGLIHIRRQLFIILYSEIILCCSTCFFYSLTEQWSNTRCIFRTLPQDGRTGFGSIPVVMPCILRWKDEWRDKRLLVCSFGNLLSTLWLLLSI